MQAQVKEWGNSQGIRLPKEVLRSAGIALDDYLDEIDELGSLPSEVYDAFQLLWDYVYEVGKYKSKQMN